MNSCGEEDIENPSMADWDFSRLRRLCASLREEIIQNVTRQGGHLASSLGAVELCVALHKCFDLDGPDAVFFDVGHQAYAHKLLSGRREAFRNLREAAGCSGFPSPLESKADPVFAGHAGVALGQAIGAAKALEMQGLPGRCIAVVGDGVLGCGILWEALNNLEAIGGRLVVILNDNQMSISPNCGILRGILNRLLIGRFYNRIRSNLSGKSHGRFVGMVRRVEHACKGLFMPQSRLFQEFGLRYLGPVDGNRIEELCHQLRHLPAKQPVLLHVVTKKGLGYSRAEEDPEAYHSLAKAAPSKPVSSAISYSRAFSQAMLSLAEEHPEVVAVSAAMIPGTGLKAFAEKYPRRCFDTGIAEEYTVSFASGLAAKGMRPVVALYSTFLQRALDNVYHDVCLNRLPVIFCIDRTGAVPDGPTHHGIYSLPFLRQMPNLMILCPADAVEMKSMMEFAYAQGQPVLLRYPRGASPCLEGTSAPVVCGKSVLLRNPADANLTIWATGGELQRAFLLAERLEHDKKTLHVRIVNARFLLPFDEEAARRYADTPQVVLDDYTPAGLAQCLEDALSPLAERPRIHAFCWPSNTLIPHGEIQDLRRIFHLTLDDIAAELKE